ncbi:MAG: hypothetical protein WA688_06270 [Thermoplasmata archaeon]
MNLATGGMIGPTTTVALEERGPDCVVTRYDDAEARGCFNRHGLQMFVRPAAAARWGTT